MLASRGYNIESLAVGETETPHLSRMTFVIVGDDKVLEQVRKQLEKIVTVVRVDDISSQNYVERDLMLIKVAATRDEIVLLFGKQPALNENQAKNMVQFADRIVLSPFTAKRLAFQLDACIRKYESNFDPPNESYVHATEPEQGPPPLAKTEQEEVKADLPIQLLAELNIKYSFERSFGKSS